MLNTKIITTNYEGKLLQEIISGNHMWKLSSSILSREKCEIYRDTGVSKNIFYNRETISALSCPIQRMSIKQPFSFMELK